MTLYVGFLQTIPMFGTLSEEDLYRISDVCAEVRYEADEVVFAEGGAGDRLFILMSGSVDVWKDYGADRADRITVLGPGQLFGELALIDDFARSASVVAREPSRMLAIGRDDFERIARPSPILRAIMQALSTIIRERTETFVRSLRTRNRELETINAALRQSETRLQAALAEKNRLLREIHYQVEANLAIVNQVLRLQAESVDRGEMRDHFAEAESRVRSLALVHEILADNPEPPCVDAQHYLDRLLRDLRAAGGSAERIRSEVVAADACLSLESAVPVGLIVTELATRALRSAFPEDRTGRIRVELTTGRETVLTVADDGSRLSASPSAADALSLRIACGLAEDRLGGRLTVTVDDGTRVEVRFEGN